MSVAMHRPVPGRTMRRHRLQNNEMISQHVDDVQKPSSASTSGKLKSFADAAHLKIGSLPVHRSRCHLTTTNVNCLDALRQFDSLACGKIRTAKASAGYCGTCLNAGTAYRHFNALNSHVRPHRHRVEVRAIEVMAAREGVSETHEVPNILLR
jgi:hypothetical protein